MLDSLILSYSIPLITSLVASHKFVLLFSSKYFLVSNMISSLTHELLKGVL